MKELDDLWGSWFAGFTAGEGCFQISKYGSQNSGEFGYNYRCKFRVNLRNDDRAILEEMQDTLGMGIIFEKSRVNDPSNAKPQAEFQVSAIKECIELVKVFEKYPLRAKKQNDFDIWKLAVAELWKPKGERNADLLEYSFLKIREVRQYVVDEELPKPEIKSLQLTIEFK